MDTSVAVAGAVTSSPIIVPVLIVVGIIVFVLVLSFFTKNDVGQSDPE